MPNYSIPDNYYQVLAQVESGGDPNAKAKTSSASGLYQFTKGTWERLGYAWSSVFNVNNQNKAIRTLTTQNAEYLSSKGIPVNSVSLYAAHFLGPDAAAKVFGSNPNTPLASVISAEAIKANPFLKNMNVEQFSNWAGGKFGLAGDDPNKQSTWEGPYMPGMGNAIEAITPSFLSWESFGRFVAIALGVILVGLAIAAFVFKNSDAQKIVATAIPAAG